MEELAFIKGQVDKIEKERNMMTCLLEHKDDDIIKLREEIISLKAQSCEETKMKEQVEIILSKNDEECKKMKEGIVFLKEEVDFLNKSLMSSQTLDDILINQRCHLDKLGLVYAGEFSSKKESASNNKDVKKRGGSVNDPSKGKSQVDIGISPTPRRSGDGVKDERSNGYHQRIPRKKGFRSTSRKHYSTMYQIIFLGYCYSCTNFGHMAKDCRSYHNDTFNGPCQSSRRNFARNNELIFMNNIECFKHHNIGHMARDCNLSGPLRNLELC